MVDDGIIASLAVLGAGVFALASTSYKTCRIAEEQKAISRKLSRGTLSSAADTPVSGELIIPVFSNGGTIVEEILSSFSVEPAHYCQSHPEWVLLLEGAATMQVGAERIELRTGDWICLPASVPHSVLSTSDGTRWLAVHVKGDQAPNAITSDSDTSG